MQCRFELSSWYRLCTQCLAGNQYKNKMRPAVVGPLIYLHLMSVGSKKWHNIRTWHTNVSFLRVLSHLFVVCHLFVFCANERALSRSHDTKYEDMTQVCHFFVQSFRKFTNFLYMKRIVRYDTIYCQAMVRVGLAPFFILIYAIYLINCCSRWPDVLNLRFGDNIYTI